MMIFLMALCALIRIVGLVLILMNFGLIVKRSVSIMSRKKRDKAMFRRTAAGSKKINIEPKIMRGGIRL